MRGDDRSSGSLFSYVDIEDRMPADHPLRPIRGIVNDVLADLPGGVPRGLRCPASPRHALLAESLWKPSL